MLNIDGSADCKRTGILQQVREVSAGLIGDAIELVPQSQVHRQVCSYLPGILPIPIEFVLLEILVVRGLARAALVEKLVLDVLQPRSPNTHLPRLPMTGQDCSEARWQQSRHQSLQTPTSGSRAELAAREEVVEAALAHIAKVETKLKRVASVNPGKTLGIADCACLSDLTIRPSQGTGEAGERIQGVVPAVSSSVITPPGASNTLVVDFPR